MYDTWLDIHIDYHDPDENEWTDDAENEPTLEDRVEDRVNDALSRWIEGGNPDAPIDWPEEEDDEELAEWARALIEEDDRECAPLVRPEGKCVRLEDHNGVEWKL